MKSIETLVTRDRFCVALGATGFLHEIFIYQAERPFLLTASLALMGFPLVLRGEQKMNGRKNGGEEENG